MLHILYSLYFPESDYSHFHKKEFEFTLSSPLVKLKVNLPQKTHTNIPLTHRGVKLTSE